MNSLLLFGGLMLAAYGALAVIAVWRPLLPRIAVREALRRPWQSALVVCGLMVGSGAILSSNILKDSTTDTESAAAIQAWADVDVTVTAPGGAYFSPRIAQVLAGDSRIRSAATGVQAGVELIGSVADADQGQNASIVRLIGFDPAAQPAFGAFQLAAVGSTLGQSLQPEQAIISASLAGALHARVGDRLQVSLPQSTSAATPTRKSVIVAGIAKRQGAGTYGLRPALYMTLPAIHRLDRRQDINVVRMSLAGGAQRELDESHELAARVRAVLGGIPDAAALTVWEPKANEMEAAVQGQSEGGTSGPSDVFADFVVLAGLVLVVNLMVTLVEERRPRLAVLRALGLSRVGLVAMLSMEGALYTLAAGLLGCIPGLFLAWLLYNLYAHTATGITGQAGAGPALGRDLQVLFSLHPASVALAIAAGAVVTLACLLVAAVPTSRFTIAAAVRDLPEPQRQHRTSPARTASVIALATLGLFGLILPSPDLRLLGGGALIAAVTLATRNRLPARARMTASGLVLTAWSLLSMAIAFTSNNPSALTVAGSLFLGIILSTLGLALAVAANLRLLERALAALGGASGRVALILRPALAYMARRPTLSGVTIATFALFLSVIVLYNGLVAMFATATSQAPYTVRVFVPSRALVVLPDSIQRQIATSVSVPTRVYIGPVQVSSPPGSRAIWHEERIALYEVAPQDFSASFFGTGITNRAPEFADDAAAWQALRTDPSRVLWTRFNTNADVTLVGSSGPVSRHIAGDAGNPIFDGIIGSRQALTPFDSLPVGTTLLLAAQPGVNAHALANQVRTALFLDGADVATSRDLVDQQNVGFRAFASAWDLYMRAGLVVAILSLGILAIRAGIGRRRAIGVLRALGYQRGEIIAGTIGEATVTTTIGAIFALTVGTVVVYIYARFTLGPELHLGFEVPSLAGALGLMYAAVVLATFGPALASARTPPAAALRLLE